MPSEVWSTWCAVNALAGRATFEEVRFVVVLNGLLVRQSVIVRDKQLLSCCGALHIVFT